MPSRSSSTLAACAFLAAPAAASDTTWTRVSTVNAANVDNELHMVLVGSRVVGAWELNTISGYSPEIIAFDPTPDRDAANLVTASQPPAADLWAFQYLTLVPDAAGNPLLVVHGTKTGATGDPTTGTSSFAVNAADGTLGPQVVHGTSLTNGGDFSAIALAGGQLLWTYKFTAASLFLGRPGRRGVPRPHRRRRPAAARRRGLPPGLRARRDGPLLARGLLQRAGRDRRLARAAGPVHGRAARAAGEGAGQRARGQQPPRRAGARVRRGVPAGLPGHGGERRDRRPAAELDGR